MYMYIVMVCMLIANVNALRVRSCTNKSQAWISGGLACKYILSKWSSGTCRRAVETTCKDYGNPFRPTHLAKQLQIHRLVFCVLTATCLRAALFLEVISNELFCDGQVSACHCRPYENRRRYPTYFHKPNVNIFVLAKQETRAWPLTLIGGQCRDLSHWHQAVATRAMRVYENILLSCKCNKSKRNFRTSNKPALKPALLLVCLNFWGHTIFKIASFRS